MPLQETSGAASYDAFGGGAPAAIVNYIEDVFSTYLFSGNNAYIDINNGIDLLGKGGLVWEKLRNGSDNHRLTDTARGAGYLLGTNTTAAQYFESAVSASAFYNNGFRAYGSAGETWASWTFRKQPKFFDVVTYTGTGAQRTVNHNLESVPGCIMVKRTDTTSDWAVYHRSTGETQRLRLNSTDAASSTSIWASIAPTSTNFTVGSIFSDVNASGGTYVAYLFAHDAGGFGLEGTDNVISCGTYTANGANQNIALGYEPQFIIEKAVSTTSSWYMYDTMRGFTTDSGVNFLTANFSSAESFGALTSYAGVTSTGYISGSASWASGTTVIYIAIRRGLMKVPTSGASVFSPAVYTGTNVDNRLVDTGIVTDMAMARILDQSSSGGFYSSARIIANNFLPTAQTSAQVNDFDSFMTPTAGFGDAFSAMNGFGVGNDVARLLNQSSTQQLAYAFRRAAGFFDVVCYTGNGGSNTLSHNLGITPQIAIVKSRSAASSVGWFVNVPLAGTNNVGYLNLTNSFANSGAMSMNSTSFSYTAGFADLNASATTYVAYFFATVAGVSKVGSYTGSGTTKQIDCGFTAGARFVMIKRTNSTGDWYVWDSARGIVSGNDPFILLNSANAQSSVTDYIDPYSLGFEISSTAPAAINANGGTFIFLAIA